MYLHFLDRHPSFDSPPISDAAIFYSLLEEPFVLKFLFPYGVILINTVCMVPMCVIPGIHLDSVIFYGIKMQLLRIQPFLPILIPDPTV